MLYELTERITLEYRESDVAGEDDYVYVMVENACYDSFDVHVYSDMAGVSIHRNNAVGTVEIMTMAVLPATTMRLLVLSAIADMVTVK